MIKDRILRFKQVRENLVADQRKAVDTNDRERVLLLHKQIKSLDAQVRRMERDRNRVFSEYKQSEGV